jgi:hypothetical protein
MKSPKLLMMPLGGPMSIVTPFVVVVQPDERRDDDLRLALGLSRAAWLAETGRTSYILSISLLAGVWWAPELSTLMAEIPQILTPSAALSKNGKSTSA